jgi:prepilin-type N-terminal cleavage/methylation domain-containing protein
MKAFTLIEIVIVVLIIGIITGMVMVLSGEQLRKLQWETVKQSILTEYQSRYSRNLTSSFFANERYEEMQISFKVGKN